MERTLIPNRDRKGATFIPSRDRRGAGITPSRDRKEAGITPSRDRNGARISMIRSAGGRLAIADHLSMILVRDGGPERWGRPKWIVAGESADGSALELVCVLDADQRGRLTVFVTIY